MYKIISSFTHWGGRKALLIQGKTRTAQEAFKEQRYYLDVYLKHRKNYKPCKKVVKDGYWEVLFIIE